ncbi:hypothetical protein PoB_007149800 [Plakobranchus ocellatus]|uniref:Uncharacterized protein n=1 Tax=Plakobranchus ocellatus TaxID=259542 RepID=A0AAV4DLR9_9GAST|nr:hypothetical protein PoB_007149800 [Plakobranchus ocellatus]
MSIESSTDPITTLSNAIGVMATTSCGESSRTISSSSESVPDKVGNSARPEGSPVGGVVSGTSRYPPEVGGWPQRRCTFCRGRASESRFREKNYFEETG